MAQPRRTVAWFDGIARRMWPSRLPAPLESRFQDTRARYWWLRDIVNFLNFALLASLVYVLATCYLDALAMTPPSSSSSSYTSISSLAGGSSSSSIDQSSTAICCTDVSALHPNQSSPFHAPSVHDCSKLRLFPACNAAADPAQQPQLVRSGSFAAPAPAGTHTASEDLAQLTLQQQLYSKAAAAVAGLASSHASSSSSSSASMLWHPRQLLRQVPLLYLWRLWFMGDLFLVFKLGMCLGCLGLALLKPGYYRQQHVRIALIATYMVLPLALLAARLATCQHPRTLNNAAADLSSSSSPIPPGPEAPHAAADASPASPASPADAAASAGLLSYLCTCPVPTAAEAYRALLPYASRVVVIDNWLHPLPLPWQAAVNVASWLCLTSCSALLRLRSAPAATTGSGDTTAAGAMSALAASSGSSSSSKQDVGMFAWEVMLHSLDGLLLSVLLPLAIAAWAGKRARKRFLQTQHKQQQLGQPTAQRNYLEQLQPAGAAATYVAAAGTSAACTIGSGSSWFSKAALAAKHGLQLFVKQRRTGLVAELGPAAAAADAVALEPTAAAVPGAVNSASSGSSSAGGAYDEDFDAVGRASSNADAALMQLPRGLDRRSVSGSSSSMALAPATPSASVSPRAAVRPSFDEDVRSSSPARHRLVGRQMTAAAPFGATSGAPAVRRKGSPSRSARGSMDSQSSNSNSSSSIAASRSSPTSSSASNRGRTNGSNSGGSGSSSSQQLASGGGSWQQQQQQQQQQQPTAVAAAAAQVQQGLQVGCSSPRGPNSALYQSPLETVVVSFKLAAAPGTRGAAAAPAAAAAEGAAFAGSGATLTLEHQQGLAASGASSQLRLEIEAAVRAIVAQSQLQVLTTSVSSFPGCVHVVMSISLGNAELLEQLAADAAAAAAAGASSMTDGSSSSTAAADAFTAEQQGAAVSGAGAAAAASAVPPLASMVDWERVVQQLQQRVLQAATQEGAAGDAGEPLQLRYMMVQDSAAQTTHWMWQAPGSSSSSAGDGSSDGAHAQPSSAAPAAAAVPAGEAVEPGDVSIADIIGPAAATDVGLSDISSLSSSDVRVTVASGESASSAAGFPLTLSDVLAAAGREPVHLNCIGSRIVSSASGQTMMTSAPLLAAGRPGSSSSSTPGSHTPTSRQMVGGSSSSRVPATAAGGGVATGSLSAGATMLAAATEAASAAAAWQRVRVTAEPFGVSTRESMHNTAAAAGHGSRHSRSSDNGSSSRMAYAVAAASQRASPSATSQLAALCSTAHAITLSSFTLPSDQPSPTSTPAAAAAALSGLSAATPPAAILRVTDSLAPTLAAEGAGLRIVITEAAGSATAAAAPAAAATAAAAAAAAAGSADHSAHVPAILVDRTFWPSPNSRPNTPGSSSSSSSSNGFINTSWPATTEFSLPELLHNARGDGWQHQVAGNVLSLNVLATPRPAADSPAAAAAFFTTAPAGPTAAAEAAGSSGLPSEFLLLQLPLLLVPSAVCEGLASLTSRMAVEAGSYHAAYHRHIVPLMRDLAGVLVHPPPQQQQQQQQGSLAAMAHAQLCSNILCYIAAQGLQECAAALQELLLPASSQQQQQQTGGGWGGGAAHRSRSPSDGSNAGDALGLHEIEPAAAPAPAGAAAPPSTAAVPATVAGARQQADSNQEYGKSLAAVAADLDEMAVEGKLDGPGTSGKSSHPELTHAMKQAAAAAADAQAARETAAEASAALANAMEGLSALSASAAAAVERARRAERTATQAARRATAAEAWAHRQRALALIGGATVESGPLGSSIWGMLGAASGLRGSGRSADADMLSGAPQLPDQVTARDVVLGFVDPRLELQYRRLKAMHVRVVDRGALLLHGVREATVVWRLGRRLALQGSSQLSLVLLCKYEAVTVLPYLVMLLCPEFWVQHRQLVLLLSQVAGALTMGMITATEIYRHEWSTLMTGSNAAGANAFNMQLGLGNEAQLGAAATAASEGLLTRPSMLVVWFYVIVPLLQQLCVPEQLLGGCVSQAVQSLLAYKFIFKGSMPLPALLVWLLAGACLEFGIAYVGDAYTRRRAVESARSTLQQARPAAAAAQ